jgi:hypothetical protein
MISRVEWREFFLHPIQIINMYFAKMNPLQIVPGTGSHLIDNLPTFSEIFRNFGQYLGLLIALIIVILVMQHRWFKKILKAKVSEILRLVDREQAVSDRLMRFIDMQLEPKNN